MLTQNLVKGELIRAWEFARFSLEANDLRQSLGKTADTYQINFSEIRQSVEERTYLSEDID